MIQPFDYLQLQVHYTIFVTQIQFAKRIFICGVTI